MEIDPIRVLFDAAAALDRAGIAYVLGGSFASSFLGEPRTTNDIDLAVFLPEARVANTAAQLEPLFFVEVESTLRAARTRASFNIFHRETMLKVDLFVLAGDPFDREQMRRRKLVALVEGDPQEIAIQTPEDLILRKLAWYRDGGGVSDRQWADVLGVLKIQAERLDLAYMRTWAAHLGVADLLDRAVAESAVG